VDFFLRCQSLSALYILVPLVIVFAIVRRYFTKAVVYRYTLGTELAAAGFTSRHWYKTIINILHGLSLLIIAVLASKPQLVDSRSKVTMQGIDIMITLDASGSMQMQDFEGDKRSRFEVAKDEALHFINLRQNDALGLVLFGKDALSRCPITYDKKMLKQMVQDTQLGEVVDPDGTVLSVALLNAINRLKYSQAKSKIIILLTDGEPSEGDIDFNIPLAIAKKMGIKIYTIGIGGDENRMIMTPFGPQLMAKVNKKLLEQLANQTGGKFFMARNAADMRAVYDTIDTLEKTEHEAPLFSKYYDIYAPALVVVLGMLLLELILSTGIWFGL
jgi:Ca-activated chloride channel family protein